MKAARGRDFSTMSWPLGTKSQVPSLHEREYFVMVAIPLDLGERPRNFVVPRIHVAAAAWIEHMNWLTHPDAPVGKRNAPVERSRVSVRTFEAYEDRWDLLQIDQSDAPVLLPADFRGLALTERVGLPSNHEWRETLPNW